MPPGLIFRRQWLRRSAIHGRHPLYRTRPTVIATVTVSRELIPEASRQKNEPTTQLTILHHRFQFALIRLVMSLVFDQWTKAQVIKEVRVNSCDFDQLEGFRIRLSGMTGVGCFKMDSSAFFGFLDLLLYCLARSNLIFQSDF